MPAVKSPVITYNKLANLLKLEEVFACYNLLFGKTSSLFWEAKNDEKHDQFSDNPNEILESLHCISLHQSQEITKLG